MCDFESEANFDMEAKKESRLISNVKKYMKKSKFRVKIGKRLIKEYKLLKKYKLLKHDKI